MSNARTPDVTFAGGAAPTHRCRVCGALWRLHPNDGSSVAMTWNLRSKECGSCCDNVEMGDQIEKLPTKVCDCVGQEACDLCAETCEEILAREEPVLEPADELEWLREQYVVLKQNNDSLRQAYSAVGQEASALRRAMSSRMPTVRERAAIAAMAALVPVWSQLSDASEKAIPRTAVNMADALVKELTNG